MLARLFRAVPTLRLVPGLPPLFDAFLLGHTALCQPERWKALHQLEQAVLSWPGVTTQIHRFGGTEFRCGQREIGHLHGNGLLDIPFSKALRDQAVSEGLAHPHHIFPLLFPSERCCMGQAESGLDIGTNLMTPAGCLPLFASETSSH